MSDLDKVKTLLSETQQKNSGDKELNEKLALIMSQINELDAKKTVTAEEVSDIKFNARVADKQKDEEIMT
jgi:predicted  nucleic acid-binding Zn-ribbon protein